ncbi:glycoside hydrolase family 127 protein [Lacipirellula parvula]|uniref:Glycosyl hydrolase n=1 Tax=Lacipirellula parvula TaxID=2650471 RepID=A0A5K7XDI1_9BACT|nr:beta-L-arabinofuranosidase domain-containing protein [Lacipirellula parvula]BBO34810.1 glycosyl hydrolase [Lacipirellula parvula]
MVRSYFCLALALLAVPAAAAERTGYPVTPASFEAVTLTDEFWLPRLQTQRKVLVPYSFQQTEQALGDLKVAAAILAGDKPEKLPAPERFRTSDLFKVMEGAAYLLAVERDPELERQMDKIVEVIAAAQEPDGYLHPARTLYPHLQIDMMGDGKYAYEDHSHELYICGHLYEAAVAYFHATGKRALLDVAEKNAQHVERVFFAGDPAYNDGKPVNQAPGHEEIELALVRLAEATKNPRYLKLAQRFLDIRGVTHRPEGEGVFSPTYAQQHAPVTKQTEPVGHAVRATYLYAGMADVAAMLGVNAYDEALDKIWTNIVDTRMHITGGLGAVHGIEGFGPEYDLPNADAFNETCAAVGNVFFNFRMFLLERDAKYLDVAEVALYNNVLAGVNFAGDRFFYVNPLAADGARPFNHGHAGRAPWFGTACCPTNLARLIPQVPGMIFASDDSGLYLGLYAASRTKLSLAGTPTEVVETTKYPYDGRVEVTLRPERPTKFAVRLRVPTWTADRFVPGELYHYANSNESAPPISVKVNGAEVKFQTTKGFAIVEREWQADDRIELLLPMPVRASRCRNEVAADRGRIAVTRGPLVYCAESPDNQGHVFNYLVSAENVADSANEKFVSIAGAEVLSLSVDAIRSTKAESLEAARLTLIPYFAWDNRGTASMEVWIPANEATLRANEIKVSDNAEQFKSAHASHTFDQDREAAIIDGRLPKNSFDTTIPRWTSWPERGKPQTVELELAKPTDIRTVEVYWYDDRGGVQAPESWMMETYADGQWAPFALYNTDAYGVATDQFNVVHPAAPLTAERLRLNIQPRPDAAAGILEVVVTPEN